MFSLYQNMPGLTLEMEETAFVHQQEKSRTNFKKDK